MTPAWGLTLQEAVEQGNAKVIQEKLHQGWPVNAHVRWQDKKWGRVSTPLLIWAAANGDLAMVNFLLTKLADPKQKNLF